MQAVYREKQVLAALKELGGEGLTTAIAVQAGLEPNGALVTLGQLRGTKVEKLEDHSRRGDPYWRSVREGGSGWMG